MEKIRTILVDDNQAYTYRGMDSRLIMHFEDYYRYYYNAIDQDFDIHDLTQLEFRLRTTTGNDNFMDNINISLE